MSEPLSPLGAERGSPTARIQTGEFVHTGQILERRKQAETALPVIPTHEEYQDLVINNRRKIFQSGIPQERLADLLKPGYDENPWFYIHFDRVYKETFKTIKRDINSVELNESVIRAAVQVAIRHASQLTERDVMIYQQTKDIDALAEKMKRARDMTQVDSLTGLFNREGFYNELFQGAKSGRKLGVGLWDLRRLGFVNDTYGHAIGDKMIIEFGDALKSTTRVTDTLYRFPEIESKNARWAGDEFGTILYDVDKEGFQSWWGRTHANINAKKIDKDGNTVVDKVIAGGGVVFFEPEDFAGLSDTEIRTKITEKLREADEALYRAKTLCVETNDSSLVFTEDIQSGGQYENVKRYSKAQNGSSQTVETPIEYYL